MEFIIGFIVLACFVGIANFFSETYKTMREKEQHEFEQQKKADQQTLDAQRKKDELDLELKRKVGESQVYQEKDAEINKLKNVNTTLKFVLVISGLFTIIFLIWLNAKNEAEPSNQKQDIKEMNQIETEGLAVEKQIQTDNLPQRYSLSSEKVLNDTQQTEALLPIDELQAADSVKKEEQPQLEQHSQSVTVDQIRYYVGEEIEFCGEVSQISTTDKATYINFGGRYPKHEFSAVIWSDQAHNFNEKMQLCVSGLVESYKGIPQIIIHLPNQILSDS